VAKPTEVPGLGPDTPRGHAAARLLATRLADARREVAAAARHHEDGVQDLRVALRRLRAALRLFGGGGRRSLAKALKPLEDALGEVRGPQVLLAWLRQRELPPAEHDLLACEAARPLAPAARRLAQALDAFEHDLAQRVAADAARERGGGRLGGKTARRRLARRVEAVAEEAARVLADPEPAAAHALQVAARKLHHTAELLAPALPAARELLRVLPTLQEELAALHGADVRAAWLAPLARRGPPPRRRVAGALLAQVREDRAARADALAATLARWQGGELLDRALAALQRDATSSSRRRKTSRKKGASRAASHSSRSTAPRVRSRTVTPPPRSAARSERTCCW
jgi:CHAD domain-containing protein